MERVLGQSGCGGRGGLWRSGSAGRNEYEWTKVASVPYSGGMTQALSRVKGSWLFQGLDL